MPYLTIINQPNARRYPLEQAATVLGRAPDLDIVLPGEGVSRVHAEIRQTSQGLVITDLDSRNGTFVNNQRLTQPTPLMPGDQIRIGSALLRLTDEATESADVSVVIRPDDPHLPAALYRADNLPYVDAGHAPQGSHDVRSDFLLKLTGLSRDVMRTLSEPELGELVTQRLREWFGADCCAMVYPGDTGGGYESPTIKAIACGRVEEGMKIPISRTAIRQAVENKVASITTNALQDHLFRDQQSVVARGLVSILCVPLWHEEHIFGLLYLDSSDPAVPLGIDHLGMISAVANLAAIKIDNLRLFQTAVEKSALDKELAVAGDIQMRLLPGDQFSHAGLRCIGAHQSCAAVGGDYYDFVPFGDNRLTVTIADVTGHGPSSALLMVACKTVLTTLIDTGQSLEDRVRRLNRYVTRYASHNQFITFFHAEIDPDAGKLFYCNAGHNAPLLLATDGTVRLLTPSGPPIGIMDVPYSVDETSFIPGDRLLLYTDGITETTNADGELYDEARLNAVALSHCGRPVLELKHAILDAIAHFSAGAPPLDDVTLVIIEYAE